MVDGWLVSCPPPTPVRLRLIGEGDGRAGGDQPGVPFDRGEARSSSSRSPGSSPAPRPSGCGSWPRAEDIADATGARSTAAWLADETRDAHGVVRRHSTLATALDQRWTQTAAAFAAGQVNLAQTRVIAEALEALPSRPRRGPAGQGRDPAGHRSRQARPARAEGVRIQTVGVPRPRHRRGGRVPETAGRRAPRSGRDQALLPPPRRRLHRPQRPHPRPRRQPAPQLPRRLHLTAQQTPRRGRRAAPVPPPRRGLLRLPGEPARLRPAPPGRHRHHPHRHHRLARPSSPTSAPPASPSPPPATRSPPTKPAGSPARPGSCRS